MAYRICRRIDQVEVFRGCHCGIGPMVVRLLKTAVVVPEGPGTHPDGILREVDLDHPAGSGQQFLHSDVAADRPVRLVFNLEVHRGRARRSVTDDPVVEFDTAAGPWPPQGNVPELDHRVVVEELAGSLLVIDRPDLASDLREYLDPQEVILQDHHLPEPVFSLQGKGLVAMVRVDSSGPGNRIGIGIAVGAHHRVLDGDTLGGQGSAEQQENRKQGQASHDIPPYQPMTAPLTRASAGVMNLILPSPCFAIRIIPLDSMPRIFLGSRLARMQICFPTISSGE